MIIGATPKTGSKNTLLSGIEAAIIFHLAI
jgi:hypothetical protein